MTRGWGRSVRMTASSRAATATRSVATRSDFAYRLSANASSVARRRTKVTDPSAPTPNAPRMSYAEGSRYVSGASARRARTCASRPEVEGEVGTPSREPPGALARFPMPPERRRASAKTHSGSRTCDELAARSPIELAGALSCDARPRGVHRHGTPTSRLNAKQFGAIESEWTIRGGQLPES